MPAANDPNDPPQPEADEQMLCRRAAGGEADALAELLRRHHAVFLGYARRKVGAEWRGKIDPEDVLQESYARVFGDIGGFVYAGEGSFYHWVTRIIANLYVDSARHWRSAKRDAAREAGMAAGRQSSYANLLDQCLPADLKTPSQALQLEDAMGCLMHCIAQLPEDYRVAVQRVYLKEESPAAVAAEWGRSEDAVRRLAGRAVERLQKCLGRSSRFFSRPPG